MKKGVFSTLRDKFKVPLGAIGALGFSATLACCYGPPPNNPTVEAGPVDEYNEEMLAEGACQEGAAEAGSDGERPEPQKP